MAKGEVEKSMGALSAAEVRYIEAGIAQDLRSDGRSRTDYRSISIDTSVIPQVDMSPQLTCFLYEGGIEIAALYVANKGFV